MHRLVGLALVLLATVAPLTACSHRPAGAVSASEVSLRQIGVDLRGLDGDSACQPTIPAASAP